MSNFIDRFSTSSKKMHSVESYNGSKFFGIPRRTPTVVNDHIQGNTAIYMVQYYDRKFPCRVQRNTIVHERGKRAYTIYVYRIHARFPFCPVYLSTQLCFSIYDMTMYDRNTEPCNTARYGRDMIVKESYTTI